MVPLRLGQAQPVPVQQTDWDRLCLSQWDRHVAYTKPVPLGLGKVKRDMSLSHGQVIYPRWRPVLVAGQALCPRWNLSQSNLSQPVPQSETTRPWKCSLETFGGTEEWVALSHEFTCIHRPSSSFICCLQLRLRTAAHISQCHPV